MGRVPVQPLGSLPRVVRKVCPLGFFISMVGYERSVGRVGFLDFREREALQRRERKTFFPCLYASRGRR